MYRDLEYKKDGTANLLVITLITEWNVFFSYYNSFRNQNVGWWEGLGLGNSIAPGVTLTDSAVFPGVLPREAEQVGPTSHEGCLWGKSFPIGSHVGSWGENRSSGTAHIQRAERKMQSPYQGKCTGQGWLCPLSMVIIHSFEFCSFIAKTLEQFIQECGVVHKVQLFVSCGFVLPSPIFTVLEDGGGWGWERSITLLFCTQSRPQQE